MQHCRCHRAGSEAFQGQEEACLGGYGVSQRVKVFQRAHVPFVVFTRNFPVTYRLLAPCLPAFSSRFISSNFTTPYQVCPYPSTEPRCSCTRNFLALKSF